MTIAPFAHHGRSGPMIGLSLRNLVLNIITLSLWRFWGKTLVRQRLWGQTTAWGDPLEYTGTGKELFLGFLLALLLVLLPLVIAAAVIQGLLPPDSPVQILAGLLIQAAIVFLIAAGSYRALRYRLSRTVWRGIRGGLDGDARFYALRWLGGLVLVVATLGWAWPWVETMLARYRLGHLRIGAAALVSTIGARGLYPRFALLWLGGCAQAGWMYFLMIMAVFASDRGRPEDVAGAMALFWGGAFVGALVTMALPYAWYRQAFLRQLAAGTRLGDAGFVLDLGLGRLVRLVVGNGLIVGLSLGVLRPWAALRTVRVACATLSLTADPDFAAIAQGADDPSRTGEGLVSILDDTGVF